MTESNTSNSRGPLEGVRVLDFSSFIAGSYAGQLLGEFGANVIKIEHVTGDGARHWGPFLRGESSFFQNWNRNKRGIAVDLTTDDGRSVIRKLAREADVAVENFRLGVTDRLGISYDALSKENKRLIYCSITAYGVEGPLASRPGYDPILQSFSGAVFNAERYCGSKAINSVAFSDYGAGLLAYGSITAALYHRERTGEGQLIRTSLLQSAMAMQSHMYCEAHDADPEPPFGIYPYRLFETQDSLIFIAGPTDKFWGILCDAIELPELAEAPYRTNADRVTRAEELTERLTPVFKQKTTDEWETLLVSRGFPCGPARTFAECFAHPQVAALDMRATVDHTSIGKLDCPGVPVHFSATPGAINRAAPLLGEHSREILTEAGYSDADIGALHDAGVVGMGQSEASKPKGSST